MHIILNNGNCLQSFVKSVDFKLKVKARSEFETAMQALDSFADVKPWAKGIKADVTVNENCMKGLRKELIGAMLIHEDEQYIVECFDLVCFPEPKKGFKNLTIYAISYLPIE